MLTLRLLLASGEICVLLQFEEREGIQREERPARVKNNVIVTKIGCELMREYGLSFGCRAAGNESIYIL